jgi:mannitol/fructose-specific phosphotransferase system IIA component (Ntr-type)
MKITEILSTDMVVPELGGTTKPQVLRELARPLATKYRDLDLAAITAVLAERERLGSTAIGDGIAIPHGKMAGWQTDQPVLCPCRARGLYQPASQSARTRFAPIQGRLVPRAVDDREGR